MATRVGLESYEVLACHGVFDFEREKLNHLSFQYGQP